MVAPRERSSLLIRNWLLSADRSGRTLPPMTTQGTSPPPRRPRRAGPPGLLCVGPPAVGDAEHRDPRPRPAAHRLVSRPSELPALFALESTLLEITFVLGPPLALGLGAVWSTGAALVASGVMMLAGTLAFATRRASRNWRPDVDATRSRAGSLRAAAIRVLVIVDLGTGVVFGATEIGVTVSAKHIAGAAAAAPLLGLWGAGSLLGGLVVTRLGARLDSARHLRVLMAALAISHGALLAGTGSLPVMGAIILLAGATIAPTGASLYAMVDRFAPAG